MCAASLRPYPYMIRATSGRAHRMSAASGAAVVSLAARTATTAHVRRCTAGVGWHLGLAERRGFSAARRWAAWKAGTGHRLIAWGCKALVGRRHGRVPASSPWRHLRAPESAPTSVRSACRLPGGLLHLRLIARECGFCGKPFHSISQAVSLRSASASPSVRRAHRPRGRLLLLFRLIAPQSDFCGAPFRSHSSRSPVPSGCFDPSLGTDFRMSPRGKRLRAGCAPPMLGWRG